MLFRKMLRDMRLHKTQFISIFVMAFLGVLIFSGIAGEWMGLRKTVGDYYRETNMADVWLYGRGFSDEDERAVSGLAGVTGAERQLAIAGVGNFDGNPTVMLHFVEENGISKVYPVSGEAFSADRDGAWLDDRFAGAHGLKAGDRLAVKLDGLTFEKTILGTVYSPEYVFLDGGGGMTPDFSAYGFAYIPAKYFPVPQGLAYNSMLLKTDAKDPGALEERVGRALGGNYSVFLTRENNASYVMFQQEIDQHRAMGSLFPIAFLAIALLTMLTTMTRIVSGQRTQIGTLKALGFKKSAILLHYVSYGFWLSLAGSALGAAIGPLTIPRLFYPSLSSFYTLPEWNPAFDPSFFIMAAVTVALCTLVTWLACRSVLGGTPAGALRPKAPRAVRHGLMEKTRLWHRLGFNVQWNLRDVFRNKARSITAVIGALGCTALLVCAFGVNDDMHDLKDWQYRDIDLFQSSMLIDEAATGDEIQAAMEATRGEAVMEAAAEFKANGKKKSGYMTVTDNATLLTATDGNRRPLGLPADGVSLSRKMAGMLGLKKGDSITWHPYGSEKWVTTAVAEIYGHPATQGVSMTRRTLEALGYAFAPTSILSPETVADAPPGIASVRQKEDLTRGWDDLTEAFMLMVYVLIAAAAALAIVVLYNLGILSFTEKERELATLKVVGLKSHKLRNLLLTQNLWLSVAGFLPGVPVGKWLIEAMTASMGDSFDMVTNLHAASVLLALAITLALSAGVNLLFIRKIRRLDMVGSLKGVE
jgi:putative ABC transport system permease protein